MWGPSVVRFFKTFDYADAFQINLPRNYDVDIDDVVRAMAESMKPSRLNDGSRKSEAQPHLQPGSLVGHWPVHLRSDNEMILGLDRSFIDLRLSILLRDENDHLSVTVTTVARYNTWLGVIYFLPVRYGHQIVIADTMRRIKVALDTGVTGGAPVKRL